MTVVVDPAADVEMVADLLWAHDPPAVEERPGLDGSATLLCGFPDRAVADAVARAVSDRGLGRAEVTAVVDHGLDGWRAHARVEDAPPFAVAPAWLDPTDADTAVRALDGPRIVLLVDPGTTFGSASHPTTRLVLTALSHLVSPGDRVLDVGCGSGVLAVGAALLGATAVGIDVDPASARVTRTNARRNDVEDRVTFDPRPLADLAADCRAGTSPFDVVAANLLAPVIRELAPDLLAVLAPGGVLVASGLLADRWEAGVAPLTTAPSVDACAIEQVDEQGGWAAVTLRRRTALT